MDSPSPAPLIAFNPLDYPLAIGLLPRRLTTLSTWVGHIPFAFALVEMCRPRTIVELGAQRGDSYCAFCQAVSMLKLPTRCTAIDTWTGDRHAGEYGQSVLAGLRAAHDPLYASFSTLLQSTFDDAVGRFDDGSIDILHIDGLHTYEAVRHDFETWRPKVSNRGVVLLHDTRVRRDDFGVYRFWEEVSPQYPSIEFVHSCGLGVLLPGDDAPGAIKSLVQTARARPEMIELYFAVLGDAIERRRTVNYTTHVMQRVLEMADKHWQATSQPPAPATATTTAPTTAPATAPTPAPSAAAEFRAIDDPLEAARYFDACMRSFIDVRVSK